MRQPAALWWQRTNIAGEIRKVILQPGGIGVAANIQQILTDR